jgi:hypothetical protein
MKSPEKGDFMVKEVPDVKHEIHEGHRNKELDPPR